MQDSFYMQVLPIAIVINNSSTLIKKSYKYIASMGHSTEHSPPPPSHTHTHTEEIEVNPHPPFRCPTVILLLILETNFYTNYSPWHKF